MANDHAGILREYGITSGERREYANGEDKAEGTLYRMVDPSAAFGAFTFLRDPDMASLSPARSSCLMLRAARPNAARGQATLLIEAASTKRKTPGPTWLPWRKALPPRPIGVPIRRSWQLSPQGRPDSRFGTIRTWPFGAGAGISAGRSESNGLGGICKQRGSIVGRYSDFRRATARGLAKVVLLLILYPTQQLAADRYEALSKSFALNVDPE